MKRNRTLLTLPIVALLIVALVSVAAPMAQANHQRETVLADQKESLNNHKFSFNFNGQSIERDPIVVIGWFQTDENGQVTAGHAEAWHIRGASVSGFSGDLSTTNNSFLSVINEADNIFRLQLTFEAGFTRLNIDQLLFLEGTPGRVERTSGIYVATTGGPSVLGIGSGQLNKLGPAGGQ